MSGRRLPISLLRLGLLAVVASGAACLDVPSGEQPECESTSDCDHVNGEVCEEGVCWGNPPEGMFAAVVSPPGDRKDLVAKELMQLGISRDGWITGLMLEKPVKLSGRIEELCEAPMVCNRAALGATITVTRNSQFQGGPGFKTVATSESGVDGPSFQLSLPRSRDDDAAYIVTIVPDGRGLEPAVGGTTAAQLVPPMRVELAAMADETRTFQLGGADLPAVDGTLQTSLGDGLSHYRVVALGQWEVGAPMTEVSTVDYTGADGKFRLVLSRNLVGAIEIVARPYGDVLAPTLHLLNVSATESSARSLVQPPFLGNTTRVTVPIKGKDGSGLVAPVRGATVRVTASVGLPTSSTRASLIAEATTNEQGEVALELLDGVTFRDTYKLEVVPPASARVGVVFDQPLSLDVVQPPILLPDRVRIRGIVVDADGKPLAGVAVTARPALRFLWSLEDIPQAFLAAIPAATADTPASGEFVLFVDRTVAGLWGHYDLVFEPSVTSRAPAFVKSEVEIPRDDRKSIDIEGGVQLPDAAFVHGVVTDINGEEVAEAEVKVFRISTSLALCGMVLNAPLSCPIPALIQGRGATDDDGTVRLTLPR